MRKYQVEIKINDFENCRKIWTYTDANNLYEALAAANRDILSVVDPGVVKDNVKVVDGETLGWRRLEEYNYDEKYNEKTV